MVLYKVSKFGRENGIETRKIGEARKTLEKLGDGGTPEIFMDSVSLETYEIAKRLVF